MNDNAHVPATSPLPQNYPKNFCPISFNAITRDKGILVISYTNSQQIGNDKEACRITYYQDKDIFLRAWKATDNSCPMTRMKNARLRHFLHSLMHNY
jgi:hypothetical protein